GTAATLADGVTLPTGTATIQAPSSGAATFTGAGEGFAGPGFIFNPGVTPNLADMQFYLSGIPALANLNGGPGNLFIEGPAGNSTGPYTLLYPTDRIIDPLKVFTQGGNTGTLPLLQLPASVTVGAGSTLTLDNIATNNNNRLPDTHLFVLNGGTLNVRENAGTPTTETLG